MNEISKSHIVIVATRQRKCDNPAPAFGGNFCRGNAKDFMIACNNMTCPTADPIPKLSEYLLQAIREHLNHSHHNFLKQDGSFVKLICRSNVTNLFFKEFPDAAIKWFFNEKIFKMDLKRMTYNHGDVVISRLNATDSGVYTCNVEYFPGISVIVDIFSVTVNSSHIGHSPRATKPLSLQCHGSPFGIIFNDTRQQWLLNDVVREDFGAAPPQSLDPYVIEVTKPEDAGVWICSIRDGQTERVWNTSRIVVNVGPAPTIWEGLLKAKYIGAFIGALLVVILLFTGLCARQRKSIEDKKAAFIEKWKQELGIDDTEQDKEDDEDVSDLESTEKRPLISSQTSRISGQAPESASGSMISGQSELENEDDGEDEYMYEDELGEGDYEYDYDYEYEEDYHSALDKAENMIEERGPSMSVIIPPPSMHAMAALASPPPGPPVGEAPPAPGPPMDGVPPPPGPPMGGASPPPGPPLEGAPPPPGPSMDGAPPPPGPPMEGAPPPPGPPMEGAPPPPGPPMGGAPPPPGPPMEGAPPPPGPPMGGAPPPPGPPVEGAPPPPGPPMGGAPPPPSPTWTTNGWSS